MVKNCRFPIGILFPEVYFPGTELSVLREEIIFSFWMEILFFGIISRNHAPDMEFSIIIPGLRL